VSRSERPHVPHSIITLIHSFSSCWASVHCSSSILARRGSSHRLISRVSIHSSGESLTARSRDSNDFANVVLPAPGKPQTMISLPEFIPLYVTYFQDSLSMMTGSFLRRRNCAFVAGSNLRAMMQQPYGRAPP
jgi:hypothetical protein